MAGAPGRWAAARAWCWPSRCRPRTSSTRRCTTGCSPRGWRWWRQRGIVGKDVTPALLEHFHDASGGASLAANLALVRANAELAAQVAVALAAVTRCRGSSSSATWRWTCWSRPRCHRSPGRTSPRGSTTAGGAGANTAAWLAARGVDVTLVARVGDDAAGRAAVAELAAAGVRPAVAVDPDAPTATVVVLVGPGGERTMLSDRGAAARLSPADLPPLDGVDHLHLSGYVLGAGVVAPPGSRRWPRRARPARAPRWTRRPPAGSRPRCSPASGASTSCCPTPPSWPR